MGCEPAKYDRRKSRCEARTGGVLGELAISFFFVGFFFGSLLIDCLDVCQSGCWVEREEFVGRQSVGREDGSGRVEWRGSNPLDGSRGKLIGEKRATVERVGLHCRLGRGRRWEPGLG